MKGRVGLDGEDMSFDELAEAMITTDKTLGVSKENRLTRAKSLRHFSLTVSVIAIMISSKFTRTYEVRVLLYQLQHKTRDGHDDDGAVRCSALGLSIAVQCAWPRQPRS